MNKTNVTANSTTSGQQSKTSVKSTGQTNKTIRRTFAPGEGQQQYDSEVLDVDRVVRVVKGGRRFSFKASVIVGNRAGKVALGLGKSRDVQSAINKAYDHGAKHTITVALNKNTITHDIKAKFGGSRIMLKAARPGTGIIAGGTVRIIADLAGIHDLVSKRLGSVNKINTARATLKALASLAPVKQKTKSSSSSSSA